MLTMKVSLEHETRLFEALTVLWCRLCLLPSLLVQHITLTAYAYGGSEDTGSEPYIQRLIHPPQHVDGLVQVCIIVYMECINNGDTSVSHIAIHLCICTSHRVQSASIAVYF